MSTNRKPEIDWLMAGGAIATLAVISPPAAGAAAVALGLHQAYEWLDSQGKSTEGPDKTS